MAENYSECYHCPGVHPLLNKLTPYDLGEDFLAEGPWKGGWMVFADGCETMSVNGKLDGRPLLYARDDDEARRIYYYILWPNLIVSVHPDYVLTHQAWPDGPNRSTVHCDLYVEADKVDTIDVSRRGRVLGHHQPRGLPRRRAAAAGTRSRSWTAGRYSNQEASVHAFDIMVADRYANDGSRTVRGWRTETAAERRLVTRRLGPAAAGRGRRGGSADRSPSPPRAAHPPRPRHRARLRRRAPARPAAADPSGRRHRAEAHTSTLFDGRRTRPREPLAPFR